MNAGVARRRIPVGVVWGGFGVVAWAAFAILTGGGTAHADDGDGALDGLTSPLIEETVQVVTEPVISDVVAPTVNAVVAPVQQAAPAVVDDVTTAVSDVQVVGPVAADAVDTLADAASSVTVPVPVTDVLDNTPVAQITEPALDVVTGLPMVGHGIDDLLGALDGTIGAVGGTVVVPPVPGFPDPARSHAPGRPADDRSALPAGTQTIVDQAGADGWLSTPPNPAGGPRVRPALGAPSNGTPPPDDLPAATPPGTPASGSTSAATRGGPTGLSACPGEPFADPVSAWTRSPGALDDAVPSSPVDDTDVSPD